MTSKPLQKQQNDFWIWALSRTIHTPHTQIKNLLPHTPFAHQGSRATCVSHGSRGSTERQLEGRGHSRAEKRQLESSHPQDTLHITLPLLILISLPHVLPDRPLSFKPTQTFPFPIFLQPTLPTPARVFSFPPHPSLQDALQPYSPSPAAESPGPEPPGQPPQGPCHPHHCQTGTDGQGEKVQVLFQEIPGTFPARGVLQHFCSIFQAQGHPRPHAFFQHLPVEVFR